MNNSNYDSSFLQGHAVYKGMVKVLPTGPSQSFSPLRKNGGQFVSTPDLSFFSSSSQQRQVHQPIMSPPFSPIPRLPPPPNNPRLKAAPKSESSTSATGIQRVQNGSLPMSTNGHISFAQQLMIPSAPAPVRLPPTTQQPIFSPPPAAVTVRLPPKTQQPTLPPIPVRLPPLTQQPTFSPTPVRLPPPTHPNLPPRSGTGAPSNPNPKDAIYSTKATGDTMNNGCDVRKLQDEMAQLRLELAAMNLQMREDDVWLKSQSEQVKELAQQQKELQTNMNSISKPQPNNQLREKVPPPPLPTSARPATTKEQHFPSVPAPVRNGTPSPTVKFPAPTTQSKSTSSPTEVKVSNDNVVIRQNQNNANSNAKEKVSDSKESFSRNRDIVASQLNRPVSLPNSGRSAEQTVRNEPKHRISSDSSSTHTAEGRGLRRSSTINVKRISGIFESNSIIPETSANSNRTKINKNEFRGRQSFGPSIAEKLQILSPKLPPKPIATRPQLHIETGDSERVKESNNSREEQTFPHNPQSTIPSSPRLPPRPLPTSPKPKHVNTAIQQPSTQIHHPNQLLETSTQPLNMVPPPSLPEKSSLTSVLSPSVPEETQRVHTSKSIVPTSNPPNPSFAPSESYQNHITPSSPPPPPPTHFASSESHKSHVTQPPPPPPLPPTHLTASELHQNHFTAASPPDPPAPTHYAASESHQSHIPRPPPPPLPSTASTLPESTQIHSSPHHPPSNNDDTLSISSFTSSLTSDSTDVTSPKANLMEQIRQFGKTGQVLKKTPSEEGDDNKSRIPKGPMHEALQSRFQAFCGTNSDSGEGESDYADEDSDNWED